MRYCKTMLARAATEMQEGIEVFALHVKTVLEKTLLSLIWHTFSQGYKEPNNCKEEHHFGSEIRLPAVFISYLAICRKQEIYISIARAD